MRALLGVVVRLFPDKGYGFLRDEAGVEDFFHRKDVLDDVFDELEVRQPVEFVPQETAKGPRAGEIVRRPR